ncbi:MAG: helix-turn-helix domain-containing protein [Hyphomicrobiales bacterium]
MTPAQCRAARALIDMSQAALAAVAVVPATVIADYETGAGTPRPSDLEAIRRALERAGVEFTDGDRPGVRLKKPAA